MYLFAKNFTKSVHLDYSRKSNIVNYQKLVSQKGEILRLSFLNSEFKKQQRNKLKNLLLLELLTLNKAFFFFELNKSKRKKVFVPVETSAILTNNFANYFCYNFSKFYVSNIKNLQQYSLEISNKKTIIEINSFDLINKNNFYFNNLKNIGLQKQSLKEKTINQYLAFFKIKL